MTSWHDLLIAAWTQAGSPTTRALQSATGIPHNSVNLYLNGRTVPPQDRLERLATYLCGADHKARAAIVIAYKTSRGVRRVAARRDTPRPAPPAATVAAGTVSRDELIAAAIREGLAEIAAAIRSLRRED